MDLVISLIQEMMSRVSSRRIKIVHYYASTLALFVSNNRLFT
jgi:hypothetical protein